MLNYVRTYAELCKNYVRICAESPYHLCDLSAVRYFSAYFVQIAKKFSMIHNTRSVVGRNCRKTSKSFTNVEQNYFFIYQVFFVLENLLKDRLERSLLGSSFFY